MGPGECNAAHLPVSQKLRAGNKDVQHQAASRRLGMSNDQLFAGFELSDASWQLLEEPVFFGARTISAFNRPSQRAEIGGHDLSPWVENCRVSRIVPTALPTWRAPDFWPGEVRPKAKVERDRSPTLERCEQHGVGAAGASDPKTKGQGSTISKMNGAAVRQLQKPIDKDGDDIARW